MIDTEPATGRVGRALGWLRDGAVGIGSVLIVPTFFLALSLGYLPVDIAHQRQTATLAAHGTLATDPAPRVHVSLEHDKGGDMYLTDNVLVHLPGSTRTALLDQIEAPDNWDPHTPLGWQTSSARTGYPAPVTFRYLTNADGTVSAMSTTDIARLLNSHDTVEDAAAAAVALAALLGMLRLGHGAAVRALMDAPRARHTQARRPGAPGHGVA